MFKHDKRHIAPSGKIVDKCRLIGKFIKLQYLVTIQKKKMALQNINNLYGMTTSPYLYMINKYIMDIFKNKFSPRAKNIHLSISSDTHWNGWNMRFFCYCAFLFLPK